jgi:Protein of unknown function (DUF4197)
LFMRGPCSRQAQRHEVRLQNIYLRCGLCVFASLRWMFCFCLSGVSVFQQAAKQLFMILILFAIPPLAQAGLLDYFKDIKQSVANEPSAGSKSPISEDTIVAGLKQALNQGVEQSVKQLGKENGFLGDASVKIPMPGALARVESGLRKVGQNKVADNFINTMNHAAEQAVPKTTDILIAAVKNMTLNDAMTILKGEPDAATRYFKRTSSPGLRTAIKPIVQTATSSVGVTESYKKMIGKAGYLAKFVDQNSLDIDQYITDKAIDGLFIKIAVEEKRIREDPVARTTDVLRNVFGSLVN